jgi:hypothetical protein
VCSCPADFLPPTCADQRPFDCNFQLVSPQPQCETLQDTIDSDPVCHKYSYQNTPQIPFVYNLKCAFTDLSALSFAPFDYLGSDNATFAISLDRFVESEWQAQLKVFNWKFLSDNSSTTWVNLTANQLLGLSDMEFVMDVASLTEHHLVGGRAYAEIGFEPNTREMYLSGLVATFQKTRLLVDFDDLQDLSEYFSQRRGQQQRSSVEEEEGENEEDKTGQIVAFSLGLGLVFLLLIKFLV